VCVCVCVCERECVVRERQYVNTCMCVAMRARTSEPVSEYVSVLSVCDD
jgi:hypothetical protein